MWMRSQVAKAASMSLNSCVNCLPGLREVDEIVKHVSTVSVKLSTTAQVCFVYFSLLLPLRPFNGLFSRTAWVSRHQKGKPFWILLEQEMMGWQWHQLDHMKIILVPKLLYEQTHITHQTNCSTLITKVVGINCRGKRIVCIGTSHVDDLDW